MCVDDRGLHPPPEQRIGLAHEELVEGILARDEHCRAPPPAPGPAPPLPEARDGPGESDRHGAVEQPDVDAQLERVRRRHAQELALDEPALDLPSLRRRVPGPVRREAPGERRSTRWHVKRWTSSAAFRDFVKQIVRRPWETS